jgi:tetratricopeptide (TPR) repeat protein
MMEAVHRCEGTVNQVLGDGIMALFGAPMAHEDHAARACYAALAMQAALRRYGEEVRHSYGLEMLIRVGLNAGEAVVRAIGNDLHMDYSAVGQTTHMAARMEQLATPGSIRLTANTLRLVEGLVQVNALGRFSVKGLSEPVEVFELIGASMVRRRLQASVARGLTRFVGRQPELETLGQAQERAAAGHGQVVAMVGEAGVGKSRLVYEFVHQLRLDPLPPVSADEFLQALLGDDLSLALLKQLLIARTEGNPFFLEESVRALVETGVLVGEQGAYRLVKPLRELPVPATVQAVLAARIDRLPVEEKRLLQTAAVIGTEVPWPLFQAIVDMPEEALHRGLAHLQAAEFLYETRLFPEPEFTFKHALTHEVTYRRLLQERRRALHARIVAAFEAVFPDRLAEQVERLAYHALRGEVWGKAVPYCRQAGVKAFASSAPREAVAYFEQALVALQHLPAVRQTQEQAVDLRLDLYYSLFVLGEHRQVLVHLHEAETLATTLGDQHRLSRVSTWMSNTLVTLGDNDRARTSGQHALTLATELGDLPLLAQANTRLGHVYYILGTYQQALDLLRQAVETVLEGSSHDRFGERVGAANLLSVVSRTVLLWSLAEVGEFTEGVARGEEGLRIAEAAEHLSSLILAYTGVGRLFLRQGDLHKAVAVLERGFRLCETNNISTYCILTASSLGYAYALSGRVAEALPLLEQVLAEAERSGCIQPCALGHLAERGVSPGWPKGGCSGTRPACPRALPDAKGTRPRSLCAAALRGDRRPAPSPGDHPCRKPLPASPGPGRGAWHAPTPGALPPWPRHPLRQDRPAGAGPCPFVYCH